MQSGIYRRITNFKKIWMSGETEQMQRLDITFTFKPNTGRRICASKLVFFRVVYVFRSLSLALSLSIYLSICKLSNFWPTWICHSTAIENQFNHNCIFWTGSSFVWMTCSLCVTVMSLQQKTQPLGVKFPKLVTLGLMCHIAVRNFVLAPKTQNKPLSAASKNQHRHFNQKRSVKKQHTPGLQLVGMDLPVFYCQKKKKRKHLSKHQKHEDPT